MLGINFLYYFEKFLCRRKLPSEVKNINCRQSFQFLPNLVNWFRQRKSWESFPGTSFFGVKSRIRLSTIIKFNKNKFSFYGKLSRPKTIRRRSLHDKKEFVRQKTFKLSNSQILWNFCEHPNKYFTSIFLSRQVTKCQSLKYYLAQNKFDDNK